MGFVTQGGVAALLALGYILSPRWGWQSGRAVSALFVFPGSAAGRRCHSCHSGASHSCCKYLIEFIEQLGQLHAEELMRFAQAASLIEWRELQILRLDADGRGDVVANEVEPGQLLGCEGRHTPVLRATPLQRVAARRLLYR